MPGAKIIPILDRYLSFVFVIDMSPGFTSFHVSVERCGPLYKFECPGTYIILYIKDLHMYLKSILKY